MLLYDLTSSYVEEVAHFNRPPETGPQRLRRRERGGPPLRTDP